MGCLLCILGSTVIVIHSPKEEEIESLNDLLIKLQDSLFLSYVLFVLICALSIGLYFGPKYGSQYVIVYIIMCSAVGSLTVMSCKGLGLAIKETIIGKSDDFQNWLTYVFLLTVVICIFIQMNYLNKALDLFNTSIVTPVYYVFFTTLVIIASAILFKEWTALSAQDILGSICGFLIVITAIFLLHAFKDMDVSLNDCRSALNMKQERLWRNGKHTDYEALLTRTI